MIQKQKEWPEAVAEIHADDHQYAKIYLVTNLFPMGISDASRVMDEEMKY